MAYNEKLADRIRQVLVDKRKVEEKQMMGGLAFMVNDKMCVGVGKDEMMCRIDPDVREEALSKTGCRVMDITGKPMKGFVLIDETGMRSKKQFDYWIGLCLEFNKKAKSSKKKTTTVKKSRAIKKK
jgi:TfoX/Sxy family transcriptional regulator of competence genes